MCITGASSVQQDILEANPTAGLRVYAVWERALATDSRSEWDGSVLADQRVTHFWDEAREVKRALAPLAERRSEAGHPDEYFLFGPEATWDEAPSGLRDSGQNILGRSGELRSAVDELVAPAR